MRILTLCAFLLLTLLSGGYYLYSKKWKETAVRIETVEYEQGWGYRIYVKGVLRIDQDIMPAIAGGKPFPCKLAAEKTAELVVSRVNQGDLPTVTVREVTEILRKYCQ